MSFSERLRKKYIYLILTFDRGHIYNVSLIRPYTLCRIASTEHYIKVFLSSVSQA